MGNQFNMLSDFGPFGEVGLIMRIAAGDLVGFYTNTRFRVQYYDFSDYEATGLDAPAPEVFDVVRWEPMMAFDGGIYFNVME